MQKWWHLGVTWATPSSTRHLARWKCRWHIFWICQGRGLSLGKKNGAFFPAKKSTSPFLLMFCTWVLASFLFGYIWIISLLVSTSSIQQRQDACVQMFPPDWITMFFCWYYPYTHDMNIIEYLYIKNHHNNIGWQTASPWYTEVQVWNCAPGSRTGKVRGSPCDGNKTCYDQAVVSCFFFKFQLIRNVTHWWQFRDLVFPPKFSGCFFSAKLSVSHSVRVTTEPNGWPKTSLS